MDNTFSSCITAFYLLLSNGILFYCGKTMITHYMTDTNIFWLFKQKTVFIERHGYVRDYGLRTGMSRQKAHVTVDNYFLTSNLIYKRCAFYKIFADSQNIFADIPSKPII